MGLNFRGRQLIHEQKVTRCENCKKVYDAEKAYCPACGTKLLVEKLSVYANYGKHGITSYTYKLPNGMSFNSKGTMTLPLSKGISYTSKTNK